MISIRAMKSQSDQSDTELQPHDNGDFTTTKWMLSQVRVMIFWHQRKRLNMKKTTHILNKR